MKIPEIHPREAERLELLNSYSILDSLPEVDYDNLTVIASEICDIPISLITLIDHRRNWYKASHGLKTTEAPNESSFCAHAIHQPNEVFIIQDARLDERFTDNPFVLGDPHVVFYAGVPLIGKDNLPLGTLCVIDHRPRELTSKQIDSLKALANQVMNLLELRRTKLQLEKTIHEVENINHDLEKFAYIAAHDLKSPLNNMLSLTNLLTIAYGEKLDAEGLQFLSMISQSSQKLKKLIDGLLDYSKSGVLQGEGETEIQLIDFFRELKELMSFDETCDLKLKTALSSIHIQRTALEQIFINLLSNAIKYNDKPVTEINIDVSESLDEYIFSVKDNGPGISKEHSEKIFELFKVIATQDKFGQRGNGIGLASVKKIVETLGGRISVESEPGKGTKFNFTLKKNLRHI